MQKLKDAFINKYGLEDIRGVISPLRICPLGAHIDHQGGTVTGMALDASVNMVYSPNNDGYIRIQSMDFPDEEYFHLNRVPEMVPGFWGNYIRGAALTLQQDHILKHGINAIISGKLPIGGLSSSAAVTTAYLMALCDVNHIEVSKMDLVQHSHWVETNYIGLKNGILDQASNILSEDDHLMIMDCSDENYKLVKKSDEMPEFEVVVVYSGLSTSLIGTDYNNRVDECKVAGWLLQELSGEKISSFNEIKLGHIPYPIYEEHRDALQGRFGRRADHFYSEQARVKRGVQAWEDRNLKKFGELMFQSGDSSVNSYECGCPELITIFEILKQCNGIYGARFSGAGYRGCCIGLIDPAYKESIKAKIEREYPIMHPQYKDAFKVNFCKTSDGARLVKNL